MKIFQKQKVNIKAAKNSDTPDFHNNYVFSDLLLDDSISYKTLKYYISNDFGGHHDVDWMFNKKNDNISLQRSFNLDENIDIIIFTGGSDINPIIYNHKKHRTTYCNAYRDEIEVEDMKKAIELGIPIFGICRGFQLLAAMAGATLIQDVTNHSGHHNCQILTNDHPDLPLNYVVNSIHHQMINPFDMNSEDYQIIGVCNPTRSNHYLNGQNQNVNIPMEPEIAFFPKIKAYGAQFHPEMLGYEHPVCQFLREDIKIKLNLKL